MASYRGSRRGAAAMAFVAFIAFSVALSTRGGDPAATRAWTIAVGGTVLVASLAIVAWMLSIRLTLASDGLQYRSLFGGRDIFWHEVERVFFEKVAYQVHGLPLGTYRAVKIVTQDGRRFVLGNSIADPDGMMGEVNSLASPHLYKRMMTALNRGDTLDLGGARLSRLSGLELKGLFGFSAMGLDEIERYKAGGDLEVWKKGARFAKKVRASTVANVYPLLAVLDSLLKAPAIRGASLYAGFAGPARRC